MATRRNFNDADDATALPDTSTKRMHYPCAAHQCPMPGVIFAGTSGDGMCGWHAREAPHDWARITQTLRDWECIVRVINRARRCMTAPDTCVDPKSQNAERDRLWLELLPSVQGSGWKNRVEPTKSENLGDWGRRLEAFLAARVKERTSSEAGPGANTAIDETHPTPFVAEVRAGLRDAPKGGNADEWGLRP